MSLGIQIAGVLFALFMLYIIFLNKKRGEFTLNEAGFWTIFWILFSFFILFPHSLDFIIKDVLDFGRTFDFFTVMGFIFVIGAIFYTYTILRRTQKKVDIIVRKLAIERAHKKNHEKNK